MSEPCFREFLERSLEALRRECAAAYAAMCAGLAGRRMRLRVGTEILGLSFTPDRVAIGALTPDDAIDVATDRQTILDIVGNRCTLLDAILTERLKLRGDPDELLGFHDALTSYVAGAVRSPSFPPLLAAYSRETPHELRPAE